MKSSSILSINWKDFVKGLVVAVLTAVLTFAYELFNAPDFNLSSIDWPTILKVAAGAGISYIVKNLLTNSNDEILKKEPVKAEA